MPATFCPPLYTKTFNNLSGKSKLTKRGKKSELVEETTAHACQFIKFFSLHKVVGTPSLIFCAAYTTTAEGGLRNFYKVTKNSKSFHYAPGRRHF